MGMQGHKSSNCEKVTSIAERRSLLISERLCFHYTKGNHRAATCKSRSCYKCSGRHHTSICDKDMPKKDPMYSVPGSSVVYPVVTVIVNGMKCRALLDIDAGSSYMSQRREYRQIEMLIHTSTTKLNIYNVDIINTRGDFTINTKPKLQAND